MHTRAFWGSGLRGAPGLGWIVVSANGQSCTTSGVARPHVRAPLVMRSGGLTCWAAQILNKARGAGGLGRRSVCRVAPDESSELLVGVGFDVAHQRLRCAGGNGFGEGYEELQNTWEKLLRTYNPNTMTIWRFVFKNFSVLIQGASPFSTTWPNTASYALILMTELFICLQGGVLTCCA